MNKLDIVLIVDDNIENLNVLSEILWYANRNFLFAKKNITE